MSANEDLKKLAEEIRDSIREGVNMLRRLDHASSLTISQLATLNALIDGPHPMSLLAEMKCVAQPTMSQHISRLEHWGLVRRIPNPQDRRVILVEITDEGREATAEANLRRNEALAVALERLTPEQHAGLREGIRSSRALAAELLDVDPATVTP